MFECDECLGTQDTEPVSACEPLDTVARPSDDPEDEDAGACGCATTAASPFAAFALLGLLARRRRT